MFSATFSLASPSLRCVRVVVRVWSGIPATQLECVPCSGGKKLDWLNVYIARGFSPPPYAQIIWTVQILSTGEFRHAQLGPLEPRPCKQMEAV